MKPSETCFSFEEMRSINSTIEHIYHTDLSLKDFSESFMEKLRNQIYFDKSDFMFFKYNAESNSYEMQSFAPVNWTESEVERYIETYMHMDDVLPILKENQEIAFRNNDIFSIDERKKTKYYNEFLKLAKLEISIDANIPLSKDLDTFAIIGLFRDIGRKDFTEKDLEIVRVYQKHLSKVLEKHLKKEDNTENILSALDNFDSLGVCILNADLSIASFNTTFRKIALTGSTSIQGSKISLMISKMAESLLKTNSLKAGPITIEIDGNSFLIEVSRPYDNNVKYIGLVNPLSDYFLLSLNAVKDKYHISNREFEILYLMLKEGYSNDEIANTLFISTATVKRHIATIYKKTGVNNNKQLLTLLKII